jgi:hypothetical protein
MVQGCLLTLITNVSFVEKRRGENKAIKEKIEETNTFECC